MSSYFNLGTYSRPISTESAEAQLWFDRGLNWAYGFNHAEAIRCFEKVIAADPDCPMGYWGVAYEAGPYYNQRWQDFSPSGLANGLKTTYHYAREAAKRREQGSPAERALVDALVIRFPVDAVKTVDEALFSSWDNAYAAAMRQVYVDYPNDADVAALTAEALICRTPWQLWDLVQETPAEGADTQEAIDIIEKGLAQLEAAGQPPHPGLLHFYIHIMEMSPTPEAAIPAGDALLDLVPDAGHLVHMPSHIYILCGEYEKALHSNAQAHIVDEKYVAYNDELGLYTLYRLHNLHFQLYAALFLGRYEAALSTAEKMRATVPTAGLTNEHAYLVTYLEAFSGMRPHVLVRFGKWEEIIAAPLPPDPQLYPFTTTVWHYAKGVAYAATGEVASAAAQQQQFEAALERVPAERRLFENNCREILGVAESMLAGELAYRQEDYEIAFAHLEEGVRRYDQLNYTEPWSWMQPPRHALGALLLEQGDVSRAAAVYRADLGLDKTLVRPSQHIDNVWALHGYAECLRRLGRDSEAERVEARLQARQAEADIEIRASCLCRTE